MQAWRRRAGHRQRQSRNEHGRDDDAQPTSTHDTPGLAVTVLTLVPRAELAGLQRAPPGFVLAIPADGRLQCGCEAMRRRPAQPLDLCAVDGVAAVVAGTVGHALDQRLRLARESQDLACEHDVLDLVTAADVVHLALDALAQDE